MMPLVCLVAAVVIVGVLWWGIDAMPAIDPTFKQIAKIILLVALVIYVVVTLLGWLGPTLGLHPWSPPPMR